MNLRIFLEKVDALINTMNKEECVDFIHEYARKLNEEERTDFLTALEKSKSITQNVENEKQEKELLEEKFTLLKETLMKIENGELYITSTLNEDYDDWYHDDDEDEYIYEDNEGVLATIEEAINYIYQCIDLEHYSEGYEIAKRLANVTVNVIGEYDDRLYTVLELQYANLIALDIDKFIVNMLYITYQGNDLLNRCEALYEMIDKLNWKDEYLEELMQINEEIADFDEFLDYWISYLGVKESPLAEKVLKNAILILNDMDKQLAYARQYYMYHPALYLYCLEMHMENKNRNKLFNIGMEALRNIDKKYVVRSSIAEITARLAAELNMLDARNQCWIEAYRSHTNITTYLRIVKESDIYTKVKKELRHIYQQVPVSNNRSIFSYETTENNMSEVTYLMLNFFTGNFEETILKARNTDEDASMIRGCMISAYLLLLYQNDKLKRGCRYMCSRIMRECQFAMKYYQNGLYKPTETDEIDLFWNCILKWKKTITLSKEQEKQFMLCIEDFISNYVASVLRNKDRNAYYICAAMVAALGEVNESRGEINGKQNIIKEYKSRYSRFSAFHKELKSVEN